MRKIDKAILASIIREYYSVAEILDYMQKRVSIFILARNNLAIELHCAGDFSPNSKKEDQEVLVVFTPNRGLKKTGEILNIKDLEDV